MSRLTIFHTNDMHNRREALRFLGSITKGAATLFLDAGDAIGGSNTIFQLREPILTEMSQIGYDAMAMGNREFNYLRPVLKMRMREAKFPILVSNVEDSTGAVTGEINRWAVKEVGGTRIGLFALTPIMYPDNSFWFPLFRFRFLDPFAAAREMVQELKQKADLIILLSHLGIDMDRKIAGSIDGINLIIGGHTHVTLEQPLIVNDTPIFHAGSYGQHVGEINLDYEQDGKVENLAFRIHPA